MLGSSSPLEDTVGCTATSTPRATTRDGSAATSICQFANNLTPSTEIITMTECDNRNRGALFRADKVNDDDRDYSGTLNVDGIEFWVSGWVKSSKKGTKFLSLSVKPKNGPAGTNKLQSGGGAPFDDEIPFAPELR